MVAVTNFMLRKSRFPLAQDLAGTDQAILSLEASLAQKDQVMVEINLKTLLTFHLRSPSEAIGHFIHLLQRLPPALHGRVQDEFYKHFKEKKFDIQTIKEFAQVHQLLQKECDVLVQFFFQVNEENLAHQMLEVMQFSIITIAQEHISHYLDYYKSLVNRNDLPALEVFLSVLYLKPNNDKSCLYRVLKDPKILEEWLTLLLQGAKLSKNETFFREILLILFENIQTFNGEKGVGVEVYSYAAEIEDLVEWAAFLIINDYRNPTFDRERYFKKVLPLLAFVTHYPSEKSPEKFCKAIADATSQFTEEDGYQLVYFLITLSLDCENEHVVQNTFALIDFFMFGSATQFRKMLPEIYIEIFKENRNRGAALAHYIEAISKFSKGNEFLIKEFLTGLPVDKFHLVVRLLSIELCLHHFSAVNHCLEYIETNQLERLIPNDLDFTETLQIGNEKNMFPFHNLQAVIYESEERILTIPNVVLNARAPDYSRAVEAYEPPNDEHFQMLQFIANPVYRHPASEMLALKFYRFAYTAKMTAYSRLCLDKFLSEDHISGETLLELFQYSTVEGKLKLKYRILQAQIQGRLTELLNDSMFCEVTVKAWSLSLKMEERLNYKPEYFMQSAGKITPRVSHLDLEDYSYDCRSPLISFQTGLQSLRIDCRRSPSLSGIGSLPTLPRIIKFLYPSENELMEMSLTSVSSVEFEGFSCNLEKFKAEIEKVKKESFFQNLQSLAFSKENPSKMDEQAIDILLPMFRPLKKLDVTGFNIKKSTLDLIRLHHPNLFSFSAVLQHRRVSFGEINEFLSYYTTLIQLRLYFTKVDDPLHRLLDLSKFDKLRVVALEGDLNETFLLKALYELNSDITELSIDGKSITRNVWDAIGRFKQLRKLSVTGEVNLSIILRTVDQLPQLTALTIELDKSYRERLNHIIDLMAARNIQVILTSHFVKSNDNS